MAFRLLERVHPVTLTLVDDLKVGDVVVAKAGSKAIGEVTKAEKSGMMGKAGELNIRLDYLKAGDTKIKLRGTKGKEGESGTTGAVVLTVLFGPIGLIKHGKNVEIKQGQALHAFFREVLDMGGNVVVGILLPRRDVACLVFPADRPMRRGDENHAIATQ